MHHAYMILGCAYAIAACTLWALCFVSPIVLEEFAPLTVALGRYAAFGFISLAVIPFVWEDLKRLRADDWQAAAKLSIVGNLVYYILLTGAIQLGDVPGPTVIIGLLPLSIPILSNWKEQEMRWSGLSVPLVALAFGLVLVHASEYQRLVTDSGNLKYIASIAMAVAALVCWTWYGIANAKWLKMRGNITAAAWTVAQGISILPLVVIASLFWGYWSYVQESERNPLLVSHDGWAEFVLVSFLVGLGSSWLATLCWTHASRLMPTTLAGQLIVFETIAAMAYGLLYRGRWPSMEVAAGVVLLCAGVALGVRAFQLYRTDSRSYGREAPK